MLMFMLNGELPWKPKHLPAFQYKEILEIKKKTRPQDLWPNMPSNQF